MDVGDCISGLRSVRCCCLIEKEIVLFLNAGTIFFYEIYDEIPIDASAVKKW